MKVSELSFLVVEDHDFQSAVLERTLISLGAAAVYTAGDGKGAMRVLKSGESPVDIVISDLMMPGVDGIELIPLLRTAAPPVALILTSSEDSSLQAAALIAKGYGVWLLGAIAKPISVEKLLPLLTQYWAARSSGNSA